ncbi:MAG: DUF2085 domain-containing protein [Chloroflexota bacterium]|nr:DUF2085 domain-containing protein [Chloroflexota bacterium]
MSREALPEPAPNVDPYSAAVLDRARREVQERRMTAALDSARRQRPWGWVAAGLSGTLVVLIAVWPSGTVVGRLRWLMQGVCDQVNNIPSWSITLPLDARCTGIYTALFVTFLYLVTQRRVQAAKLPPPQLTVVLLSAILVMAVDGLNSLLHHSGYNLYPPHDGLRLASGSGAGLALAILGLPLLNGALRGAPHRDQPVINSWKQLAVISGLVAVIGMLAWEGVRWFFYPLVLLSVTGMIGGLLVVNLVAVLLIQGLYRRVLLLAQLARPATISIVLTVGELTLLAWLRMVLEQGMNSSQ